MEMVMDPAAAANRERDLAVKHLATTALGTLRLVLLSVSPPSGHISDALHAIHSAQANIAGGALPDLAEAAGTLIANDCNHSIALASRQVTEMEVMAMEAIINVGRWLTPDKASMLQGVPAMLWRSKMDSLVEAFGGARKKLLDASADCHAAIHMLTVATGVDYYAFDVRKQWMDAATNRLSEARPRLNEATGLLATAVAVAALARDATTTNLFDLLLLL